MIFWHIAKELLRQVFLYSGCCSSLGRCHKPCGFQVLSGLTVPCDGMEDARDIDRVEAHIAAFGFLYSLNAAAMAAVLDQLI